MLLTSTINTLQSSSSRNDETDEIHFRLLLSFGTSSGAKQPHRITTTIIAAVSTAHTHL